ncbi:MAG: M48 family metalloprotease, partial [Vulcanisaeta sp.]
MAATRVYQVIRELIKDPQSLINYVENYSLKILDTPYVTRELSNGATKLIIGGDGAELSINHGIRIRGRGRSRSLLNAVVLRYLGTGGLRRITVLLIRRGNRVYRVDDLPRIRSLPLGLISLVIVSVIAISIITAILRVVDIVSSIHIIMALLLTPMIIPIVYSYILQVKIRHYDLRGAQIIKFTLEYEEFDNARFNNALRLLEKVEKSRSLDVIRRAILSIVNNPDTAPRNYYEEVIDVDKLRGRLGIKDYGIYIINMDQCNAASIGLPGINYVILTSKLVSCLNEDELAAVIMHEVGHVVHGDSAKTLFLMSLAQLINVVLITRVIPVMSLPALPILIGAVFAEILVITLIMRLSEYAADKYAMRFVRNRDLALALLKVAWR